MILEKGKDKNMANIITGCRILCSILLLFVPAFSPTFYILYSVSGFTDMIDGAIARKTNTASEFGSRLDTIADIAFVAACMIKLLPVLKIPTWLCIWIGVIAIIKVLIVDLKYCGYILRGENDTLKVRDTDGYSNRYVFKTNIIGGRNSFFSCIA